MKIIKFLIMLIGVFAIVVMLVSCTSYKRPGFTFPSTRAPQIATTMVEVTVHPGIGGGKLKVQFDPRTGKCSGLEVNGKSTSCDDERFVIPLEKTYFCTPPDANHLPNTKVYNLVNGGTENVYCGNVKFLTDGADIRFKADSTAENKECKNVGGYPICY